MTHVVRSSLERVPEVLKHAEGMNEERYFSRFLLRRRSLHIGRAPLVELLDADVRPTGNYSIVKNFLCGEVSWLRTRITGWVQYVYAWKDGLLELKDGHSVGAGDSSHEQRVALPLSAQVREGDLHLSCFQRPMCSGVHY